MLRGIARTLLLLSLIGAPTVASATWSGYWSYYYTPLPGHWVWTWVWHVPTTSFGVDPPSAIDIENFWSLRPVGVTFSGLLLTDFSANSNNTDGNDLTLAYTGNDPLSRGEYLGTVTLVDPDVTPLDAVPTTLDYTETFGTTSGLVQENGTISSAVPEPDGWSLMVVGLGALGLIRRRRA